MCGTNRVNCGCRLKGKIKSREKSGVTFGPDPPSSGGQSPSNKFPIPAALFNSANLLRMAGCSPDKTHYVGDGGIQKSTEHRTLLPIDHWSFLSSHKRGSQNALKGGEPPQRKHLLVIEIDYIMKMMFFFQILLVEATLFVSWHSKHIPAGKRGKHCKNSKLWFFSSPLLHWKHPFCNKIARSLSLELKQVLRR